MPTPSISDLKRALAIQEQIDSLEAELRSVLGGGPPARPPSAPSAGRSGAKAAAAPFPKKAKRRQLSPEARARIVTAQKKRWAKFRKQKSR